MLKGYRRSLCVLTVFFVTNIALQLTAPQLLSRFVDSTQEGAGYALVGALIAGYLILTLLGLAARVGEQYFSETLGWRMTNDFQRLVLERFLNADLAQHDRWLSGEMMTRLDEDVQGLYKYWSVLVFQLLSSALLLAGVLAALWLKSWKLAMAMLALCLTAIFTFRIIQNRGVRKYAQREQASAQFGGLMKEQIDNAVEIATSGAQAYSLDRLKRAMRERFRLSFPAGMMYANLWSASTLLEGVTITAALGMGVALWGQGAISLGEVYLIYQYTALIYDPLQQFRCHMDELQSARAQLLRVKELLSLKSTLHQGETPFPQGPVNLEVEQLRFGYDAAHPVLRGISFQLKPGEHLGVMGETGCGKSTLIKLLARLYEFDGGDIRLGGVSVRALSPEALRERIAYCAQDVQLLHATLRENITLYDRSISDESILRAAERLRLADWLKRFPQGLDTPLEMGEDALSAGEAQLVTLIRLALRNPALVLLDEISARLDPATERRMVDALSALTEGKMVVAIAHKPSALEWVDRVIRLDRGAVVQEEGRAG